MERQFTFDDPEDSYWNDGTEAGEALFDDTSRTAVVARQALDDLFETRVPLNNDVVSVTDSDNLNSDSDFELCRSNINLTRPSTSSINNPLESRDTYQIENKLNSLPSEKPRRLGSVSVLSDCSVGSFVIESTSNHDYGRIKGELRQLQRDYKRSLEERFRPLSVQDAIARLRSCKQVSLDFYKSKQQKLDLLDSAISSLRDDIILVVILHLKQTLIGSIFREVLILKPEAADVYVNYLKVDKNYQELVDTLFALGRIDEASMIELALAFQKKQPEQKINALKRCVHSGLNSPNLQTESNFVQEKIDLLERQMLIESADSKPENQDIFIQFPKKATLVDQSLLTTVYYCSLYHYQSSQNLYTSPLALKQAFNLSDREYCWMSLSALSRRQDYAEIEKLLTPKKIFSSQKLVCPFPWPAFFALILKFGSPQLEVLTRWLKSIEDLEERFKIAGSFGEKGREVQFDTILALKDKKKLVALMTKLTPHSANYLKAQAILSNTAQKWKD